MPDAMRSPAPFPATGFTIARARSSVCAVTPLRPCRCERLTDRVLLLVGEGVLGTPGLYLLREDAGVGPTVEAREDDAVALGIQQRDRERLISSGVGERIEPDHTDLLDAALREPLKLVVQPVQRLHSLGDGVEAPELSVE